MFSRPLVVCVTDQVSLRLTEPGATRVALRHIGDVQGPSISGQSLTGHGSCPM